MTKFESRANLFGSRVDRQSGIIKDVSLIALGDARGHGKAVDEKTLQTVMHCAAQYKDGLRVKFNPNTFTHGAGALAGYIPPDSLRIKDGKVIGDLHLYDSFAPDAKAYLHEIAERTPANIGLSIEFSGEDEDIKGAKFARCEEIFAATIVDLPAANPTGLFSVDNANSDKDTFMKPEELTQLTNSITASLKEGFAEIKQMFAVNEFPPPPKKEGKTAEAEPPDEETAAGVTDEDDDATKQKKVAAYRAAQSKPIGQMSADELGSVIAKANMQFFRKTGGNPARVSAETEKGDPTMDAFEKRVDAHMTAGARGRGVAIMRARRDAPAEYNAWRAKQNPTVQNMQQQ